jgi:hypothetical protein
MEASGELLCARKATFGFHKQLKIGDQLSDYEVFNRGVNVIHF